MVDENLRTLFYYFIISGVVGSAIGALISILGGEKRIRLDASAGIGFLVGAAFGTLAGIFASFT